VGATLNKLVPNIYATLMSWVTTLELVMKENDECPHELLGTCSYLAQITLSGFYGMKIY
jgi:hypothetical protein